MPWPGSAATPTRAPDSSGIVVVDRTGVLTAPAGRPDEQDDDPE